MTVPVQFTIYESELASIVAQAAACPDRETGGDVFGLLTHSGAPTILLVTGPGPRAAGTIAEFQQDPDYVSMCQKELWDGYGVQYLGAWHSHHRLGIPQPSRGDVQSIESYATARGRSIALETIVTIEKNRVVLQFFYYASATDARRSGYSHARVRVLNGVSPFRDQLRGRVRWVERAPHLKSLPKWEVRQPAEQNDLDNSGATGKVHDPQTQKIPKWVKDFLKSTHKPSEVDVNLNGDFVQLSMPVTDHAGVVLVTDTRGKKLEAAALFLLDGSGEPQDLGDQLSGIGYDAKKLRDLLGALGTIRRVQESGNKKYKNRRQDAVDQNLVKVLNSTAQSGGHRDGME